jgi:hypothetical protein
MTYLKLVHFLRSLRELLELVPRFYDFFGLHYYLFVMKQLLCYTTRDEKRELRFTFNIPLSGSALHLNCN